MWFDCIFDVQEVFLALHVRASQWCARGCIHDLTDKEQQALRDMGFWYLLMIPYIQADHKLLTTLAKRWYSDHNTFHLPTGEETIMLEDMYRIL